MKPLKSAFKILGVAAMLCCAAPIANSQNLVADGGFEASTDLTTPGGNPFSPAWTLNQPGGFSNVGGQSSFAHSGNNYANLAPAVGATGTLSQTIPLATIAGRFYTISFWLANNSSVPTNSFSAFFNGVLIFATTSPPFNSNGNYVNVVIPNFLATSNSSTLQFQYRHDDDFWRLDDVVVATPEGGVGMWLTLPVVAGLCLLHFRSVRRRNG